MLIISCDIKFYIIIILGFYSSSLTLFQTQITQMQSNSSQITSKNTSTAYISNGFNDLNSSSLKHNFFDNSNANNLLLDPNKKIITKKMLLQRQKSELIKMLTTKQRKVLNLERLQKSLLMKSNEKFSYLVNCLKSQINKSSIQSNKQNHKHPRILKLKIQEHLFNSLQQATLISEKNLKQNNYLQSIFNWYTNVFQNKSNHLPQTKQKITKQAKDQNNDEDEDWKIRHNYKSNMPLQINQYNRKVFVNNFNLISFQSARQDSSKVFKNNLSALKLPNTHTGEQAVFSLSADNGQSNIGVDKNFSALKIRAFYSSAKKVNEQKQFEQLKRLESGFKKQKSHYQEQLSQKYYKKNLINGKIISQTSNNFFKYKQTKNVDPKLRNLNPKLIEKIEAIRLGVTLSDFKLNKQKYHPRKNSNQSMMSTLTAVFHPSITSKNFTDIKKKKLQKFNIRQTKNQFPDQTEQSNQIGSQDQIQHQTTFNQDESFEGKVLNNILNQNSNTIKNITGINLISNPFNKIPQTKKK